jgi:hypothetical protein
VPSDVIQPSEQPSPSAATPSFVGASLAIEASGEHPLPPSDAPWANAEEWNRIESASSRANASPITSTWLDSTSLAGYRLAGFLGG